MLAVGAGYGICRLSSPGRRRYPLEQGCPCGRGPWQFDWEAFAMRGLSDVRGTVRLPVVGLFALAVFAVFAVFVSGAMAQTNVQHGIGLTKGCTSPTKVGDPYSCSYTVTNVLDEAEDTLTITGSGRCRPRGQRRCDEQHHRCGADHDDDDRDGCDPERRDLCGCVGERCLPDPVHGCDLVHAAVRLARERAQLLPLHRAAGRLRAAQPSAPRRRRPDLARHRATIRPGPATRTATRIRRMSGRPR